MKPENVVCPSCGGPMVSRKNRRDGSRFWGCRSYPDCTGTRDVDGEAPNDPHDEAVLPSQRRAGQDLHRWRR